MTVHNGNSKNMCTAPMTKNLDFSKLALKMFLWKWQLAQVKAIQFYLDYYFHKKKKQYSSEYLVVHLIINWLVIKGGPSS